MIKKGCAGDVALEIFFVGRGWIGRDLKKNDGGVVETNVEIIQSATQFPLLQ